MTVKQCDRIVQVLHQAFNQANQLKTLANYYRSLPIDVTVSVALELDSSVVL